MIFSDNLNASVCCKLADFGTAEYVTEPLLTRKVANPAWLAPEILQGNPYDER